MENLTSNTPLSKLSIFSFKGIQMKTFHITWLTFFFCFFAWFGLAPLMPIIREELHLTKPQIGNIVIASVSATILARLIIGKLCDTLGPRLTYTGLLVFSAIPTILVGFAHDYTTFLLFRFAIGIVGASFVLTQFHTSQMFAPNIVGTANAVAGGWGNLGGGVTNMVMPLIFAAIVGLGYTKGEAWRLAMIIPGSILLILAFVYYKFTKDTPKGNYADIEISQKPKGSFKDAAKDPRTWVLFLAYAACFGIEITFDNVAALYFVDTFKADLATAGMLAGIFGFMNIFARAIGGIVADRVGKKYGMRGKGWLLACLLILEGLGIMLFAKSGDLTVAIVAMLGFAMFLKMANGATYAMVPFIDRKNVGSVAGGNVGGMLAGFLFKSATLGYGMAFVIIGSVVAAIGVVVLITKFQSDTETVIDAPLEVVPEVARS
jgi:MFS transporter, NNP family, nitrate/nitrite transporter